MQKNPFAANSGWYYCSIPIDHARLTSRSLHVPADKEKHSRNTIAQRPSVYTRPLVTRTDGPEKRADNNKVLS